MQRYSKKKGEQVRERKSMIIVTIQHHGKNKWLEKNELVRMGKKRAHTEIMSGVVGCVCHRYSSLPLFLSFPPSDACQGYLVWLF